jgi:hypothetical protein
MDLLTKIIEMLPEYDQLIISHHDGTVYFKLEHFIDAPRDIRCRRIGLSIEELTTIKNGDALLSDVFSRMLQSVMPQED